MYDHLSCSSVFPPFITSFNGLYLIVGDIVDVRVVSVVSFLFDASFAIVQTGRPEDVSFMFAVIRSAPLPIKMYCFSSDMSKLLSNNLTKIKEDDSRQHQLTGTSKYVVAPPFE